MLVALQLVAFAWACGVGVAGVILVFVAQTNAGRVCGVAAILAGLAPRALLNAWEYRTRFWRRLAVALIAGTGVALALAAVLALRGQPGPDGRLVVVRADGTPYPDSPVSVAALVPEQDQLAFGFTVIPLVDSLFTRRQGAVLRQELRAIHEEARRDPDFAAAASAMPDVYRDLWEFARSDRRIFAYIPRSIVRDQPAPVLVYFHGSGGLWQSYLWILAQVAERTGTIVVAPSGGIGNWFEDEACVAFDESLAALDRVARIDRMRVSVVGLSNGGRAVTQVLAGRPAAVRAALFVSPVFDDSALGNIAKSASIAVLTGRRDDRVPIEYVEAMVSRMRTNGATPSLEIFDDADHFLFFIHRNQLVDRLVRWLMQSGCAGDRGGNEELKTED